MYEMISMEIAASGMSAQRVRMAVTASNLANASSTRRPDGPGPYQRQYVIVKADTLPTFKDLLTQVTQQQSNGEITMGPASDTRALLEQHLRGVRVLSVASDESTQTRYLPHHPDADADGNVLFPDISVIEEMTDMISASRNYEANLAVMKNTRDMLLQTIELLQS